MLPPIDTHQILNLRTAGAVVDPTAPPAVVTEQEPDENGVIKQATTVFLIGKECPFRCLMCDLWKHTTSEPTPPGALVRQLSQVLPQIQHREIIKLYNASNFFDPQSVPLTDRNGLATLVQDFETVVIENHPKLLSNKVPEFAARLNGQLQVAMGLETADERILRWLNKQMTVADYERACEFLIKHGITIRTFLLLPAPGVESTDALSHTVSSVRKALDCGSRVTSLIPLRAGNGVMDWLLNERLVHLPDLSSVANTFASALKLRREKQQRIFLDLWNIETLATTEKHADDLRKQLHRWNMEQPTST